jgi:hypothetical protein
VPTRRRRPSPATSLDAQELKAIVLDLAAMRQSVHRLAAGRLQIAGDILPL